MLLSISEIVKKATELKTDEEKISWLKAHDNPALRTVLKYTYDKENIKFLIPKTPPTWKKNNYFDVEGKLYKEARRLRIFIQGGGYDNLDREKRENLFIDLLENIDNGDAELLCKMIAQEPIEGLSKSVVVAAFPEEFPQNQVDKSNQ
jgi:hypothetical protein